MKLFKIRSTRAIRRALLFCLLCLVALPPIALALDKVSLAVPVVAVQYMPIYFGIKEGVFAAEGLAVEIHVLRTDLAIAALNTGRLDYIAHGGAALRGATRGFPLKLIFALDDKAAFWLLTQPGIRDAGSLKGKKIGISFPGDTPHLVLKRFLRKRGLDPDRDVIYVAGQISPIGLQGLAAGALDGAVMAPPHSVLAEERGFHSLAFLGEEVPDAPTINGIITSDKKIRNRPSEVQRMVRAALRSVRLYRQKKDPAVAFLASQFNLNPATAKKVYANASAMLTPNGEVGLDKVRDVLNLARELGQPPPDDQEPKSLVDFSFLHEARRARAPSSPADPFKDRTR
jgi:ABC-type nitrate/sulfonate/bicarbonate transport system substrate-binding protein